MNLSILRSSIYFISSKNLFIAEIIRIFKNPFNKPFLRCLLYCLNCGCTESRLFSNCFSLCQTINSSPNLSIYRLTVRDAKTIKIINTSLISYHKRNGKQIILKVKDSSLNFSVLFINMLFLIRLNYINISNEHINFKNISCCLILFKRSNKRNKTALICLYRNKSIIIFIKFSECKRRFSLYKCCIFLAARCPILTLIDYLSKNLKCLIFRTLACHFCYISIMNRNNIQTVFINSNLYGSCDKLLAKVCRVLILYCLQFKGMAKKSSFNLFLVNILSHIMFSLKKYLFLKFLYNKYNLFF